MPRPIKPLAAVAALSLMAACAHHRDVRPGEGGLNSVELSVEQRGDGYRKAMNEAEDYCDEHEKHPVIVDESTRYVGSMDEDTYRTTKTVTRAAEVVGGVGYVFGGKTERNVGGAVGLGGVVGDLALGDGYRYVMRFRCAH
jgi:hypothetical protein